ncbi:MAG TPA: hypothetical protein VK640_05820 [Actinomycetes bacterium]|nr:hypothetical protein [Actinomycetes bacterium]
MSTHASHDTGGEDPLRTALKRAAVALKGAGVPFALGGGYAAWARGGPEPEHDVDFVVAPEDAARAEEALRAAGLKVEHPPEDWLFKVWDGEAMVDLIHRINGAPVTHEVLHEAVEMEVLSVLMPVLSATELMSEKLRALDEHECDYGRLLPVARALREQVDWPTVRGATAGSAYAETFLVLLERLGVVGSVAGAPDG